MENVELEKLRKQIDAVDAEILDALARRMEVSRDIGSYKQEHNLPALDQTRWHALLATRIEEAEKQGLSAEFVEKIFTLIHAESVHEQENI